jgi:hypothetical protein
LDGVLLFEYVCVAEYIYVTAADEYTIRLNVALELAKHNPVYENIASKFFEVRNRL